MQHAHTLAAALFLSTVGVVGLGAQTPASLDALLEQILARTGVPGLVAAAVKDGKIVALGARGVRELGKPEPILIDDPFLIGSCTKPMTRLLYARLSSRPDLGFERTLAQLLPGVPMREEYQRATAADLMRHTAGLQPYTRINPQLTPIIFELTGTPMEKRNRFIEHLLMEEPAGVVGRDFVYSNAGFALLGNILERVTGRPWEELIQAEVFQPLGMRNATIGLPTGERGTGIPKGHQRTPEGAYKVASGGPPSTGLLAPAGGVCLPIEDFARFAVAQAEVEAGVDGTILPAGTAAKLPGLRPVDSGPREGNIFAGGQGSFTAAFAVWPSKRFGVVVCTNGGGGDAVCTEAIKAIQVAFAPEIAAEPDPAPAPGSGPRLGVMLRGEDDGRLLLDSVVAGGIAEKAGLKAGDEIVSIDGTMLKDFPPGAPPPALKAPGAKIVVRRAGQEVTVQMPGSR